MIEADDTPESRCIHFSNRRESPLVFSTGANMIHTLVLISVLAAMLPAADQPEKPHSVPSGVETGRDTPAPEAVRDGLKDFYRKCSQPDGSFRPGIDPNYRGMSDAAYSDL